MLVVKKYLTQAPVSNVTSIEREQFFGSYPKVCGFEHDQLPVNFLLSHKLRHDGEEYIVLPRREQCTSQSMGVSPIIAQQSLPFR